MYSLIVVQSSRQFDEFFVFVFIYVLCVCILVVNTSIYSTGSLWGTGLFIWDRVAATHLLCASAAVRALTGFKLGSSFCVNNAQSIQ